MCPDGLAAIGSSVTGPVVSNGIPWTHIGILTSSIKNRLSGIVPKISIFEEFSTIYSYNLIIRVILRGESPLTVERNHLDS